VEEKKESRRLSGFNSLLATASIDAAKRYYAEFKAQQRTSPSPSASRSA
jgi:type I restriction enzyme R subunit